MYLTNQDQRIIDKVLLNLFFNAQDTNEKFKKTFDKIAEQYNISFNDVLKLDDKIIDNR